MKRKDENQPVENQPVETAVKTAKPQVSNENFVLAYIRSTTYAELAARVGLTESTAKARAARLRKAGVQLAKYARKVPALDVSALNDLINLSTPGA
jgi:DNA-directed RNA polymerase specialized sigma24 family protein